MAQLQMILGYLRKYHFWLLCVAAVLVSVFGWMKAQGTLSAEYQKGKSDIESTFGSLKQVQDTNPHPNGTWTQEINKLTDARRENVAKAWQTIYNGQQKVLAWPEVLGATKFLDWIKDPKNANAEIPQNFRDAYRNLVLSAEFPKLVEIAGAKLEVDAAARPEKAPKPEEAAAPERTDYKVDWDAQSQTAVYNSLKLPDVGVPTDLEVRLRQEDLWVYQALLGIIKKTNETAVYTSHVKRIGELSIGAAAAKKFQDGMKSGKIQLPAAEGEAAQGGEAAAAAADAAPAGEGVAPAPDQDRYVDDSGTPLGPGVAAGEAFKRLPVFLKLEMNQLEINRLLTNCVNNPLPVEVRQLRINPEAAKESGPQRAPERGQPQGDAGAATTPGALDAPVEIHGIIYIYNPPDPAKLGQPAAATEPAVAGG
jgi:hypothetical protein